MAASFKGRTPDFESGNEGSNPSAVAKLIDLAQGAVRKP